MTWNVLPQRLIQKRVVAETRENDADSWFPFSPRLKGNLNAAEERCDELQRLLDQSRASETQTRIQLRTLQQQQRQLQKVRESETGNTFISFTNLWPKTTSGPIMVSETDQNWFGTFQEEKKRN